MKALALVGLIFVATSISATQIVDPPLNGTTIVGTWEALSPEIHPATLWHMEINKKGGSYLAQITVGAPCIVWRLISSDIKDGIVKLHFEAVPPKELRGVEFPALWIAGTGSGIETRGGIDAMFCGNNWPDIPPPRAKVFGVAEKDHMFFIKGTWTRDLGNASRTAEKAIKDQVSK